MLYLSLLISATLLSIVNVVAFSDKRAGIRWATLYSIVPIFLCWGMTAVLLSTLGVAVAGVVCWACKTGPRWYLFCTVAATFACYFLIMVRVLPELRTWARLKTEYPIESLAPRLAYEDRPGAEVQYKAIMSTTAEAQLTHLEHRLLEKVVPDDILRRRSLAHVHAGVVEQFVNSPGFGSARRFDHPRPYWLEGKRPEATIPQAGPPYAAADLTPAPLQVALADDLLSAHDDNILSFLNPSAFGYILDREHVAGFRPHQFDSGPSAPQHWQVKRLELVGLLKWDGPLVYLSPNLPRMDQLSDVATRSLDGFENEALLKLRHGEDLILQETRTQMRMLGSLRATKQCLGCHRVSRGDLLGAFSYQMSAEEAPAR